MLPSNLIFLHTVAPLKNYLEGRFENFARANNLPTKVRSIVKEEYLRDLLDGKDIQEIYQIFEHEIDELSKLHCPIIITCSSLGDCVERYRKDKSKQLYRIDQWMMQAAINMGKTIGLAVTNSVTIAPSTNLLAKLADESGKTASIEVIDIKEDIKRLGSIDANSSEAALIRSELLDKFGFFDVVPLAQVSIGKALEDAKFQFPKNALKSYDYCFQNVGKL